MKKVTRGSIRLAVVAWMLGAATLASADVIWTGSGDTTDFYDDANWDFSLSAETANPVHPAPLLDNYTISGATITENSAAFSGIPMAAGNTVTLDDTSLIFANNNGFGIGGTLALENGAFHDGQYVSLFTTVDATSTLRLRGAGNAISADGSVNLVTGAKLDFAAVSRWTNATQASRVFVNGTQYSVGDSSLITVVGNVGTAIPEPATFGLVAMFGAGLMFVRRRLSM